MILQATHTVVDLNDRHFRSLKLILFDLIQQRESTFPDHMLHETKGHCISMRLSQGQSFPIHFHPMNGQ